MLSQFQHLSGEIIGTGATSVVPAGETVSVTPQKGDDGEEGVTSEGTVSKLLPEFPAARPFSPAHLCLFNSSPDPPPARVRQVSGGESQSCRDDAGHAVAPQWGSGCGAGNPEAQEAREAGRVAAGHVELQDASVTCAAPVRTNCRDPKTSATFLEHHYLFSHCRDLYTVSFVKKKTEKKRKLMEIKRIY